MVVGFKVLLLVLSVRGGGGGVGGERGCSWLSGGGAVGWRVGEVKGERWRRNEKGG